MLSLLQESRAGHGPGLISKLRCTCPRCVRLCSKSGDKADIAGLRICAKSAHFKTEMHEIAHLVTAVTAGDCELVHKTPT